MREYVKYITKAKWNHGWGGNESNSSPGSTLSLSDYMNLFVYVFLINKNWLVFRWKIVYSVYLIQFMREITGYNTLPLIWLKNSSISMVKQNQNTHTHTFEPDIYALNFVGRLSSRLLEYWVSHRVHTLPFSGSYSSSSWIFQYHRFFLLLLLLFSFSNKFHYQLFDVYLSNWTATFLRVSNNDWWWRTINY